MTRRQWRKGANGLWSSRDPVIVRAKLRQVARDRIDAIAARFEAVMQRNGWKRAGNRWRRAS